MDTNVLKMEIYFDDLNYEIIEEEAAYDTLTLLADLGGIFSFYLGLSIIALFEYVELVFDLLLVCCKYIRRRNERQTDVQPMRYSNNM